VDLAGLVVASLDEAGQLVPDDVEDPLFVSQVFPATLMVGPEVEHIDDLEWTMANHNPREVPSSNHEDTGWIEVQDHDAYPSIS
jgi:hypothetical protein